MMIRTRFRVAVPFLVLSLSLALAACDGGGNYQQAGFPGTYTPPNINVGKLSSANDPRLSWLTDFFAGNSGLLKTSSISGIKQDLAKLYPYFNPTVMQAKVDAAKTSFQFLRSFVPYYYLLLSRGDFSQAPLLPLAELRAERGWCMGDPHVENFGVLLDEQGQAVFTVNDWDDSGPCPLYADFLRFATSIVMARGTVGYSIDLGPVVAAYSKGLSEKSFDPKDASSPVRSMIETSNTDGQVPKKKDFENSDRQSLKLDRADKTGGAIEEVDSQTRRWIQDTITRLYGSLGSHGSPVLLDVYKTAKVGGGSHGMTRYRTLINLEAKQGKKPKLQIIEFKQMVQPGVFPLADSAAAIPQVVERYSMTRTLALERAPVFNQAVANPDMVLRPLWKGNQGVSLDDYKASDSANPDPAVVANLLSVVLDEAYALGAIHAKTASPSYLQSFEKVSVSEWALSADAVSTAMDSSYRSLTK